MKKPSAALSRHLAKALPVAVEAALEGGAFIASKFGKFKSLQLKPDTSLVTEVDKGAEKKVLGILKKAFPHDEVMAEETGLNAGQQGSAFRWHVDPLDGTTNFVHGFPFFCVSIGLQYEEGPPVLGVIYQPITKDLYVSRLGQGALRNGKRLHVSKTSKISDALLSTGFSLKRQAFFQKEIESFSHIVTSTHAFRRTGSAALDLAHVATGQFDGFWEQGLNSWDVCAGISLLTEAGGTCSRFDGKPYHLGDVEILASNGKLHRQILSVLGR
jgi:myo-inositol-1(or 4)-monophosphatase